MGIDASIREAVERATAEPTAGSPHPLDDMDLQRLVATVWRSKLAILLATLLGIAGAYVYLSQVTPIYRTTADVLWESERESVVDIQPVIGPSANDFFKLQSQIEIVGSVGLLGKVVDALDLLETPEFNPALRPASDGDGVTLSPGALIGAAQAWLGLAGPAEAPKPVPRETLRRQAIERLRGAVEAAWVENSYVIRISAASPDPVLATRIANMVADKYILDQLEKKFEATRRATAWLSERVGELRTELEAAEQEVEAFSSASELVSVEALAAQSRQVKELRDRAGELKAERAGLIESRDAAAAARAEFDFPTAARHLNRPELDRLAAEIGAGEAAARAAPDRVARFDLLMEREATRIAAALERLAGQRAAVLQTISALEAELDRKATALVELRQLEREAEASRLIYESFLARLKETSVQQGIQQPDARLLSEAWEPARPASPNRGAAIAIGAALGLIGAIVAVVLRERMNATFRTPEDLEARTGLAVLGSVPSGPIQRRTQLVDFLVKKPGSGFAEAIRNLRTSVLLANVDKPPQVIMLNSGLPGEGKTTTCIALAQISRSLGKRVVLVECDLRRRIFRRYFGIAAEGGLLSILSGAKGYHEVVHIDAQTGLHVVPGEESSVNAADVFASRRFSELIEELRQHYDYIYIDTPPVLAVPDARVIAQSVDALLYVVRWNRTPRDTVAQGLRHFRQVNARVTGLVLNGIDIREMARYGYRSYGYYRQAARYYQD